MNGVIPAAYVPAWPSLENFTLDGAAISGYVPDPFGWTNLTWYTLQNTPVYADLVQPFWVLKSQAAALQRLQGLRLGECIDTAIYRCWRHFELAVMSSLAKAMRHDAAAAHHQLLEGWTCQYLCAREKYPLPVGRGIADQTMCLLTAVHVASCAGGTNLQLPGWTAFKQTLRTYNWTQLTQIGLPRSRLTGPIGPLKYYLPQLTMLDLSGNQLTGSIPPDLSSYAGFRYLNLADNMLYGKSVW